MDYEKDFEESLDQEYLITTTSSTRSIKKKQQQHSHNIFYPSINRIQLVLFLLILSIIFSFSFLLNSYWVEETYSSLTWILEDEIIITSNSSEKISTAHDFESTLPAASPSPSPSPPSPPPPPSPPVLPTHLLMENTGTISFSSDLFPALLPLRPPRLTSTVSPFSSACLENWLVKGKICTSLYKRWKDDPMDIDIIWTWGNSSGDSLMKEWKNDLGIGKSPVETLKLAELEGKNVAKRYIAVVANKMLPAKESQFRDHDELRFSIRSILSAFPSSNLRVLHLIVGDSPSLPPRPKSNSKSISDSSTNFISNQIIPRVAQIPQYLNLSKVEFSGLNKLPITYEGISTSNETEGGSGGEGGRLPVLRIRSHSEIFKTAAYGEELAVEKGEERDEMKIWENDERVAKVWRNSVLPTFNSLAIESQIPNLEDVADTVLYLNDDFFVLKKLSQSDVASPLTGPVLRLQRDLMVSAIDPYAEDVTNPQGEWKGLGYAAYLLDNRFGVRQRPYIVHQAKSVSMALLREAQETFLDEFTTTAASRFRGQSLEIQTSFLRIHFIIEKHREALLWAFFYARSDLNQDGIYSNPERNKILSILGWNSHSPRIPIYAPARSSLASLNTAHLQAGLPLPLESIIDFTSMDGYPNFLSDKDLRVRGSPWPSWSPRPKASIGRGKAIEEEEIDRSVPVCHISIQECFGPEFLTTSASGVELVRDIPIDGIFKRISFEIPRCGDCIIIELLRQSGSKGFEAFLPPLIDDTSVDHSAPQVEIVGLSTTSTYLQANFTLDNSALPLSSSSTSSSSSSSNSIQSLRRRTLSLIHRYSYTLASSNSEFIPVQSSASLAHRLALVDIKLRPTFLALNDETGTFLAQRFLDKVDEVMRVWLKRTFGKASRWEMS